MSGAVVFPNYRRWALAAGPKLRDLARSKALSAVDEILYVEVKDQRGPLVDTRVDETKQFTHEFLYGLRK